MEAQKEKWKPCLVLDLMSSEESVAENSDPGDYHTFTVRSLPWRADKVNLSYWIKSIARASLRVLS